MKKILFIVAFCLTGMATQAQQNLSWGQGPQVASPDVHADNSVTFNLIAPEAQKVQITGDMLPTRKVEFGGNSFDAPLGHLAILHKNRGYSLFDLHNLWWKRLLILAEKKTILTP